MHLRPRSPRCCIGLRFKALCWPFVERFLSATQMFPALFSVRLQITVPQRKNSLQALFGLRTSTQVLALPEKVMNDQLSSQHPPKDKQFRKVRVRGDNDAVVSI